MVLVTHGTNTLLHTAEFLHRQYSLVRALKDKTIILTGAMVALSCGPESDGVFNLRFALRQLEAGQISRGVYIVLCDYQDPDTKSGAWKPRLVSLSAGAIRKDL